jgi:hypothetical protein
VSVVVEESSFVLGGFASCRTEFLRIFDRRIQILLVSSLWRCCEVLKLLLKILPDSFHCFVLRESVRVDPTFEFCAGIGLDDIWWVVADS